MDREIRKIRKGYFPAWRPVSAVILVLAVAGVMWFYYTCCNSAPSASPMPGLKPSGKLLEGGLALARTRQSCMRKDLEEWIKAQRNRVERNPSPLNKRLLAEGLLELCNRGVMGFALSVGVPNYSEIPPEVDKILNEALILVRQARKEGDESNENLRIEAGLLSFKIVGLGTALKYNGKICDLLKKALDLDKTNPRVFVALGCRKLLAPSYLGQDLDGAIKDFCYAAKELIYDERPFVFAAMAHWLKENNNAAETMLEKALDRTPANFFAKAVLQRIRSGDKHPFQKPVEDPFK